MLLKLLQAGLVFLQGLPLPPPRAPSQRLLQICEEICQGWWEGEGEELEESLAQLPELLAACVTPGDRETPQACSVCCFSLGTFACGERGTRLRERLIIAILAAGAVFLLLFLIWGRIHTAVEGLGVQLQEMGQCSQHQLPASSKQTADISPPHSSMLGEAPQPPLPYLGRSRLRFPGSG